MYLAREGNLVRLNDPGLNDSENTFSGAFTTNFDEGRILTDKPTDVQTDELTTEDRNSREGTTQYQVYTTGSGAENGTDGYNTLPSDGYNTAGSDGYNTAGSGGYNTGSDGYNTGSDGYNTGSDGYNTGSDGYNTGSDGYNTGSDGYNTGSDGYNTGSDGYNTGSDGYNTGSDGYNTGSDGYNTGSDGYNTGSDGYNTGSDGYNTGSDGYNTAGTDDATFATEGPNTSQNGSKEASKVTTKPYYTVSDKMVTGDDTKSLSDSGTPAPTTGESIYSSESATIPPVQTEGFLITHPASPGVFFSPISTSAVAMATELFQKREQQLYSFGPIKYFMKEQSVA
eukprot:sb/3466468/